MVRKKSQVFCGTIIKSDESLDSQLKNFWEIEKFKTPTPIFTKGVVLSSKQGEDFVD